MATRAEHGAGADAGALTTMQREPIIVSSSITTGTAFGGSSTPPMPTPPERCTFLPTWAPEPTVAQVSTIVPVST